MSRIYAQQKRPAAKAAEPSYGARAAHAPSLVSGTGSSDLDAMMQAKYRQHFLDNQIPTAEAEADRIAASVSGARTPEEVKTQLGEKMGADFSIVTFHTDSAALKQADAIGARAYTSGSDVYFGSGGFDPGVAAHELVHTVQQGMVSSTMGTITAPTGGVQMMPDWLKKAGRSIKNFISPEDASEGSIFDAPTRLINKLFGLPFQLFNKPGSKDTGSKAPPPVPPKPEALRGNPIGSAAVPAAKTPPPLPPKPTAAPVAKPKPAESPKPASDPWRHARKYRNRFSTEDERIADETKTRQEASRIMAAAIGQKPGDVDLGTANAYSMLKNAHVLESVMADFQGLHVGSIRKAEGEHKHGVMNAGMTRGDIRINEDYYRRYMPDHHYEAKREGGQYGHAAVNFNYTLAHEMGHVVNGDLTKKLNSPLNSRHYSDSAISRALLADALTTRAADDEALRGILYEGAGLDRDAKLTSSRTLRKISRALNGNKENHSALLDALHKGGYTSGYGASNPLEAYAEAFGEHYRNQSKEKKYTQDGQQEKLDALQNERNLLSDTIVSRAQQLFGSRRARWKFRRQLGMNEGKSF